ncbi:MAG: ROK family protein, partial [Patescibacteria group bacterium]
KKSILGVDIGGSKIKMVLRDGAKVLKEWKSETANLENLKKGLEFFSADLDTVGPPSASGRSGLKVGIGLPGLSDFKNNKALFCKNLSKFNNVNLKTCFPMEVRVDNDAKCFLRAELAEIISKKPEHVLGVIFGTGIGGAINGYKGANGWAGEFGHIIIDKGKTWEKLYQETKNKPKEQEKINAIGIANLINIFNPEVIILGGAGAKNLNKQLIEKYLLVPKKQMPKFVKAKLKDNSVAVGAAMLWN